MCQGNSLIENAETYGAHTVSQQQLSRSQTRTQKGEYDLLADVVVARSNSPVGYGLGADKADRAVRVGGLSNCLANLDWGLGDGGTIVAVMLMSMVMGMGMRRARSSRDLRLGLGSLSLATSEGGVESLAT